MRTLSHTEVFERSDALSGSLTARDAEAEALRRLPESTMDHSVWIASSRRQRRRDYAAAGGRMSIPWRAAIAVSTATSGGRCPKAASTSAKKRSASTPGAATTGARLRLAGEI